MAATALWELSARALREGLLARSFSAREVVQACLGRIDDTNPGLNAICTLTAESALAAANESDRRFARGEARELEGIPILVKDNIHTAGVRTTFGSRIFENYVPEEDAISVARAKAAGAILLGKTNTPEFACEPNTYNLLFGATRNPWDIRCSVGGSSGGNASALAAGMAPLAIGTDYGGSVRVPAAYCGVTGMRASPGRIPLYPAEFAWDTFIAHVHGPMARNVGDLGLLLAILAGPDDWDPSSLPAPQADYRAAAASAPSLHGTRVAFSPTLGGVATVDDAVEAVTRRAVRRLEELGCSVTEADPDCSDLREVIAGVRAFGQAARLGELFEKHRDIMGPRVAAQVEDALRIDVKKVADGERRRSAFYQRLRAFMEPFDILVTNAAGITAFRLDHPLPDAVNGRPLGNFNDTNLCNQATGAIGLPSLTLPSGLAENGMPVGLHVVVKRLCEERVLAFAAAFEAAMPPLGAPQDAAKPAPQTEVVATSAGRYAAIR